MDTDRQNLTIYYYFRFNATDEQRKLLTDDSKFTEDLNLMHEAEKLLDDDQYKLYINYLYCGESSQGLMKMIHMPAHERAEAFLKATSLWTQNLLEDRGWMNK